MQGVVHDLVEQIKSICAPLQAKVALNFFNRKTRKK